MVQVAAGAFHSMALTASGGLYSWGRGDDGQLGHGDKEESSVPRVVSGIGMVVGMAGGGTHSLVTTAEGRVLGFGRNGYVQEEDSDGEELLDEPFFVVDGRLGLGAAVGWALTPTALDGINIGEEEEGKEGKE